MRVGRGSRLYGGGIGANVFTPTAAQSQTCPAGQHYVPDAGPIRGLGAIGACVPNTVSIKPLTFRAPASQVAPQPNAPMMMPTPSPPVTQPLTLPFPPAGGGGDATAAPSAPVATCPPLWPWWYLLIAAGLGAGLGVYGQRNQHAVRKNTGRIAGRLVNRATDAAIARVLG